jgi:lipoprotein-anchoring transpeptidase ErfK/SrfK
MRWTTIHVLPYVLLTILPGVARAQVYYPPPVTPVLVEPHPQQTRSNLGGGFIEFLFGEHQAAVWPYAAPAPAPAQPPKPQRAQRPSAPAIYVNVPQQIDPVIEQQQTNRQIDPQFLPTEVPYDAKEPAGTIIVDTPNHFLYFIEEAGRARRYGIGVGRPGFTWSGEHKISAKKEWPDWVPPEEMLQRQPYLPHFMPGGPRNPLGARAMYLGNTLYRIHGSNEPWTIGHNVSSGCIRMRNVDVIDLYERVKVGTKVVVL